MLKLMKYEFRRQLFSKFVILGGLLVLTVAFFIFYLQGNEAGVSVVISFMGLGTLVVLFYAPLECLFTFDKDVNTKQGYMLFLMPKKSTTILGAKLSVSIVQTLVISTLFFIVVPFLESLAAKKFFIEWWMVSEMAKTFGELIEGKAVGVVAGILLAWMFSSCLGLFITAIPVQLGKLSSIVKVAGYLVAIALVVFVMSRVERLLFLVAASQAVVSIFEVVYMLGVVIVLFFGTAKLLDEKVSV